MLADLRDPDTVLKAAGERLDLDQPTALMFVACLHHIRDDDDPAGIVARYLTLVPRSRDDIVTLFSGRPLVDPGLVLVSRWRPDGIVSARNADRAWAYGGIARL